MVWPLELDVGRGQVSQWVGTCQGDSSEETCLLKFPGAASRTVHPGLGGRGPSGRDRDWRLKVLCIFQEPSPTPTLRPCPSVRTVWPKEAAPSCKAFVWHGPGLVLCKQRQSAPRPGWESTQAPPHRKPVLTASQDPPTCQAPRVPQDACLCEGPCVDGRLPTGVLQMGDRSDDLVLQTELPSLLPHSTA